MTSWARLATKTGSAPAHSAVSCTPSRSTMRSSSAPRTKTGVGCGRRSIGSSSSSARRSRSRTEHDPAIRARKRSSSASGSVSLKKVSRHTAESRSKLREMKDHVIFAALTGVLRKKRAAIFEFPEGGTEARSASPASLGPALTASACAMMPPNECDTSTGARGSAAANSPTSAACDAMLPATPLALELSSLPPCPRSDTACTSYPALEKYGMYRSAQHHAAWYDPCTNNSGGFADEPSPSSDKTSSSTPSESVCLLATGT
mmetsp:Transcript_13414/g.44190  ORF Transcript_13414/g.44190 Transcript_13414/m.44190 type:complete len:261 (-) Transcript_13414:417-1199(-)